MEHPGIEELLKTEETGFEPAEAFCPTVFKTVARPIEHLSHGLCGVRSEESFTKNWQGRPDSNRNYRVWNPRVCQLTYAPQIIFNFYATRKLINENVM